MAIKNADVRGRRSALNYLRSTSDRARTFTFYRCTHGHYLHAGVVPAECPICGTTTISTLTQTEAATLPWLPVDGYTAPEILDEADI